ncbi:MAG: hypothetical protein ACM3JI_05235, partial [Anaerolineae bacterium]
QCRSLTSELKEINHREELIAATPKLKKKFNALVDLMIEARKFQKKHAEETLLDSRQQNFEPIASEQLLMEIKRIYGIEGGRQIVESAQREALLRLDAFERSLARQKDILLIH